MREMKDSGIEWIGEIPAEWILKKAKYCITITNGSDPVSEGDIPVYGSGADSFKTCGEYKEGPIVLIGRKGATLHIPHYIEGRYWNVDTAFDVRTSNSFSLKYYYYCATSFDYKSYILQTTLPSMTQTIYENMFLPVPSTSEQTRIADFLDAECARIDEVIEKTRASIEEYKKLKQSVITEAVTKGIRLNRPMKDSGIEWIGEIPAEWTTPKMGAICLVITDYVASGSFASLAENVEYLDEPDYAMLVRTADISYKGYSPKPVYINQHSYEFLSNSNLFGGELMFPNIGASVGDVYIVPVLYERMSLAPNAIMVKTNHIDRYYYYYFQSKPGRLSIEDIAQSTAQAKFNKTDFRQLRVLLPSDQEQQEIVEYLDKKIGDVDILIKKKEQLLTELETYKKSLIYEYVTGKKEVIKNVL